MLEWLNDNPYTCPVLMVVQGLIRRQKWHYGCSGWVLLEQPHARARAMWPGWLVLAEARWWNTWLGVRIRGWCGTQQREYRLRMQRDE